MIFIHSLIWRSGSVIRRMNEVTVRCARLVLGWVTVFGRKYHLSIILQEGLTVASIARDDPSTLPGDDPFPRARMHRDRNAR